MLSEVMESEIDRKFLSTIFNTRPSQGRSGIYGQGVSFYYCKINPSTEMEHLIFERVICSYSERPPSSTSFYYTNEQKSPVVLSPKDTSEESLEPWTDIRAGTPLTTITIIDS